MAITRVQVRIPRTTALPEDVVVNTFHFNTNVNMSSEQADSARTAIARFYALAVPGTTDSIMEYMSNLLDAANTEFRFYHLSDPEPRIPFRTEIFSISAARATTDDLPSEVALCLSYRADLISGTNAARRRGRVYIGPLNTAALGADASGDVRPNAQFIATVIEAAQRLHTETTDDNIMGVDWAVYSPTNNDAHNITAGWVDNAFDTQRRRGGAPTVRTNFVA